jgi:hypothetical protein
MSHTTEFETEKIKLSKHEKYDNVLSVLYVKVSESNTRTKNMLALELLWHILNILLSINKGLKRTLHTQQEPLLYT